MGNTGFVGDTIQTPIGQLPELYFTRNQLKQRLKHKRIRCQIEIEQQFHVKVQMWIQIDQIHIDVPGSDSSSSTNCISS